MQVISDEEKKAFAREFAMKVADKNIDNILQMGGTLDNKNVLDNCINNAFKTYLYALEEIEKVSSQGFVQNNDTKEYLNQTPDLDSRIIK